MENELRLCTTKIKSRISTRLDFYFFMITDAPLAPSFLCCNIIVANKKVTSENYFPIIKKKVPEFSNIYSCGAPAPRLVIIPPPPPSENLRNIGICSLFGSVTEKVCITKAR